jgi:hypothetical protein
MKIGHRKFYAGVLSIPAGKVGGVTVRHLRKPAGAVLRSDTPRTAFLGGQRGEQITFTEPTVWHELSEKGRGVWMTDLPIEQRQMDELIARSNGRVLVGGLGLGYAVVALAARPKVTEIVVVEQNPAIIKLVWKATVKQVQTLYGRDITLTCLQGDLHEYLLKRQAARKGTDKPEFNWALFDIWQSDGEGVFHEVVVPLRKLAHGVVTHVVCWNEDVMRGQLYNGLESRLHLLRLGPKQRKTFGGTLPTLDGLTADGLSIYQAWAVPFWKWYRDYLTAGDYDVDLVRYVMRLYVNDYGKPEALNGIPALRQYRTPAEAVPA